MICLFLVLWHAVDAQVDGNGNPVFNSIQLSTEQLGEFELSFNYYTIQDNIDNFQSSVFVSETPSLDDYIGFARNLPSYFFMLNRGPDVVFMIMLNQKVNGHETLFSYTVLDPATMKVVDLPCNVSGEVTEVRAEEMLKNKYDPASEYVSMGNNKLFVFDGMGYRIQPFNAVKDEVRKLAHELIMRLDDQGTPEDYIRKESKGGRLDFAQLLESEGDRMFLENGVAYNRKDFAIYLWGQAVKQIGVSSKAAAKKLWEEIYGRALTAVEVKSLNEGFTSKPKTQE